MKAYIYVVRDKRLKCYGTPTFSLNDPEQQGESVIRGIRKGEANNVPGARDCALYCFGSYEDNTGKFEIMPEPVKLLDYEDYFIKEEKEAKVNGKTRTKKASN